MKKFLSFISLFFLGISINCYAQNTYEKVYDTWHSLYEDIKEDLYSEFESFGTNTLFGLNKSDVDKWEKASKKIDENYKKLLKGEKVNDNTLEEWKQYNHNIYNAIRRGGSKWSNLDLSKAEQWNQSCNNLSTSYDNLKSKKNKKSNQGNNTGNNNNSYRRAPQASEEEYRNHISRENNELSTENSEILNASAKAFEVCLFYPLAVKYNKTYCRLAYEAAKALIDLNIASIDSRMQSDWDKISPLLQKYGEYNEDVINYLNYCKSEIMSNRGKVTYSDIDHYKKMMRSKMNKYYYIYIDDETIPYLNNVLDDFFEILQEFANNDDAIKENFFNNFINVNLEPEE